MPKGTMNEGGTASHKRPLSRFLSLISFVIFAFMGCGQQDGSEKTLEGKQENIPPTEATQAISSEKVEALFSQANELYEQGKYLQAKAAMTQAYAAFEQLPEKDDANRINFLRELAKTSYQLEEDEKAIEYADRMLKLAKTYEDKAFAHSQLGSIRRRQGRHEQALDHHEKALNLRLQDLGETAPEVGEV